MRVVLALILLTLPLSAYGQSPAPTGPDPRAIPMLVGIDTQQRWAGTGVLITRGLILTARHAAAARMHVYLPGAVVDGHVACMERDADLAVVTTETPPNTPSYVASLAIPKVGQHVKIGGYPGGRWTVTEAGIVGIAPSARIGGVIYKTPILQFHPQHTLGRGASGSPLINDTGHVVGILSGGAGNENVAFPLGTALQDCRRFLSHASVRPREANWP